MESLCQDLTHFFFIVLHWAAHKCNNAHFVVFALPVLQRQLHRERKHINKTEKHMKANSCS